LTFSKGKNVQSSNVNVGDTSSPTSDIPIFENSPKRLWRVNGNEFDISSLEFDHRLHQYGSMMLINEMKFEELTLNLVCTDIS
jgi:hypothetical protein